MAATSEHAQPGLHTDHEVKAVNEKQEINETLEAILNLIQKEQISYIKLSSDLYRFEGECMKYKHNDNDWVISNMQLAIHPLLHDPYDIPAQVKAIGDGLHHINMDLSCNIGEYNSNDSKQFLISCLSHFVRHITRNILGAVQKLNKRKRDMQDSLNTYLARDPQFPEHPMAFLKAMQPKMQKLFGEEYDRVDQLQKNIEQIKNNLLALIASLKAEPAKQKLPGDEREVSGALILLPMKIIFDATKQHFYLKDAETKEFAELTFSPPPNMTSQQLGFIKGRIEFLLACVFKLKDACSLIQNVLKQGPVNLEFVSKTDKKVLSAEWDREERKIKIQESIMKKNGLFFYAFIFEFCNALYVTLDIFSTFLKSKNAEDFAARVESEEYVTYKRAGDIMRQAKALNLEVPSGDFYFGSFTLSDYFSKAQSGDGGSHFQAYVKKYYWLRLDQIQFEIQYRKQNPGSEKDVSQATLNELFLKKRSTKSEKSDLLSPAALIQDKTETDGNIKILIKEKYDILTLFYNSWRSRKFTTTSSEVFQHLTSDDKPTKTI